MRDPMNVFDRRAVRLHRDRSAARWDSHRFLVDEVGARLLDRLNDVNRDFSEVLDLGCRATGIETRRGIGRVVSADLSEAAVRRAPPLRVVADEEALPFADGAFDLVVSNFVLHWVNDLPGALLQIRRALKPDGLLLAAMPGGETLHELRRSLLEAEAAVEGGASPRASPFADVRDAGALMQRAGFALPVVDTDQITVTYGDALALMRDLRFMGESNAVNARRKCATRRETLFAAAARYRDLFAGSDGRLPATFEILFMTAWAPHESQQKPLRPGSAAARLSDALDAAEQPAGEKADPTRRR